MGRVPRSAVARFCSHRLSDLHGVSDPAETISDGLQIGSFCLLVNIRESEFLSGITHAWNPHSECFLSPAPDSVQDSSHCHCLELHFWWENGTPCPQGPGERFISFSSRKAPILSRRVSLYWRIWKKLTGLVQNWERNTSRLYIDNIQNAESRLPGEISTTSDMQLDTTWMVESEEELNSLLMRVKEESEKAGLKLNIQKNNITASRPITSWQIDRKNVETLTHFTFLGSQITADSDCNHKIKRYWFLGRKAMTHLDSILKSRDITLLTKVQIVKAMVFPVIMYRCESWTIKKAECWRIDAFELWCWRLLRVPQTARRPNQSILKEINLNIHWKDWCWNSNTLATWCEELTHWKRPWCWQRLRARREGSNRGWDGWTASLTQWTWVWANSGSRWWTGRPGVLQSMRSPRVRHNWVTEQENSINTEQL